MQQDSNKPTTEWLKEKKIKAINGQTSTWLKCFDKNLRELCIKKITITMNVKEKLHNNVGDW